MNAIDEIAAQLQGYDPQAMTADGVRDFLARLVTPVQDAIELPLFEALGRVLAADVVSPFDVPPHDNSAMDGFAFFGEELTPTLGALRPALPPGGAELARGGPALRSLAPDAALELQVAGTALAGKA